MSGSRREAVRGLLDALANEILHQIKEMEPAFEERWVPAADVKNLLELNFVAVPRANRQYGEKGWLFAILARMLEDQGLVEYRKQGGRAYYRST